MVFTSFGTLSCSVTLLLKQTRLQRGESVGCILQSFIREGAAQGQAPYPYTILCTILTEKATSFPGPFS